MNTALAAPVWRFDSGDGGGDGLLDKMSDATFRDVGAPPDKVAARLGLSEPALRVAVHRLRKRYREVLRAEVTQTVADPAEVDAELRHLLAAVAGV